MHFQIYRWYVEIVYCFSLSAPFQPPQNPPGSANSPETQIQSCPQHPSGGRQGAGRGRKGFTLAVEYNMHVTWEGRGVEMYIQTPGVRGPRPGGTKKGFISPLAGRGALRQPLGGICPERGDSCHPCPCSPNLNWRRCC